MKNGEKEGEKNLWNKHHSNNQILEILEFLILISTFMIIQFNLYVFYYLYDNPLSKEQYKIINQKYIIPSYRI